MIENKEEGWGRFIVIEGIDGSGKTTIARRLCDELKAVYTFEPTSGPIGRMISNYLQGSVFKDENGGSRWMPGAETMALLYTADRMDHQKFIIDNLSSGLTVISDRYHYSTLAYQAATSGLEGVDCKIFSSWVIELAEYCLEPDLTIVLDIGCQEAEARRRERKKAEEIFEVSELQTKLACIYEMYPAMEFKESNGEGRAPRRFYMGVPGDIWHVPSNNPEDVVVQSCLRIISKNT